ncbi:family 16 glycosylhydrolase [Labilibacter marinus]|uniref:family 16 glycosylhydrolase n=1 Tax=Labilibacter marinus TaxID=1477105 RepID=UPI0008343080|nr:family 16 glycosylhydrolase [Labilibacter marinus]
MKKVLSLILLATICTVVISAKPPKPPKGFRWVINTQFSDEFNGSSLDDSKWLNHYNGGWQGRAPAWFNPEAVSVSDGNMKIKSGVLDKPKGNGKYTMYGGAVSSTTKDAHFGYYECKAKASKIAMSTTFWMSNDKVPFTENDDCDNDSYSQELDIQEAVGGSTTHKKFITSMNCNTHYRYVKCGERKETFISKGTGHKLRSEVSDEYHIYGAWWIDAKEVMFFANDAVFDTVQFRTDISKEPFDRPMQINMVTETYDWQPAPSAEDLENPEINTAYYDWIRSYKLVPINKVVKEKYEVDVFTNSIEISTSTKKGYQLADLVYAANEDCQVTLYFMDKDGEVIKETKVLALEGLGHQSTSIKLKKIKGATKVKAQLTSTQSSNIDLSIEKAI